MDIKILHRRKSSKVIFTCKTSFYTKSKTHFDFEIDFLFRNSFLDTNANSTICCWKWSHRAAHWHFTLFGLYVYGYSRLLKKKTMRVNRILVDCIRSIYHHVIFDAMRIIMQKIKLLTDNESNMHEQGLTKVENS